MKKQTKIHLILTLILIVTLILISILQSTAQENVDSINKSFSSANPYYLVWEDNFNGTILDKSKWTIIENGDGGGNKELQYYRPENISVGIEPSTKESCLIITAKKEKYKLNEYTSGKIVTQGKMSVKFGKIEARIKSPITANGLWPAFWMLGSDYPDAVWPKCGEIDIMEMGSYDGIKTGKTDRYINAACHWGENFNNGKYPSLSISTDNSYNLQDDFHLFSLIWDKNAVKMYLDLDKYPNSLPYYQMPIDGKIEINKPALYLQKQFFIILNLAIGGNFSLIFDPEQITALSKEDRKMYVDYVKVYQKGEPDEELSGTSFYSK